MKKNIYLLFLLGFVFQGLTSCGDNPPNQYIEQTIVQGYLLVDKPVSGILVSRSIPIDQSTDNLSAQIRDAKVQIYYLNQATGKFDTLNLQFRDTDEIGYYFPDQGFTVQPQVTYYLKIQLSNGTIITGQTLTPRRFQWVKAPLPQINYPADTLNLPRIPEYDISWTKDSKANYYLIRTLCHDTLEYGKYLDPPDAHNKNRRCYNIMANQDESEKHAYYKNVANWNLLGDSITPTVWMAFKWFGPHNVSVYSPDDNMLNWFKNTYFSNSSENDPLLSTVKGNGTYGVFGSAAVIEKEIFVLKNQR
jgi:hypothetical protein